MRIDKPGVYDLSAEEYHADCCPEPSLSSSIAKLIVNKTPRHAWAAHPRLNPDYQPTQSERFDIGNAAHSFMLRDPKCFEIVNADAWTTKAAREQRDAARLNGKIPLLVDQYERVVEMVAAARVQLDRHIDARAAFTNGRPEASIIWEESGVWFRARLDWLPDAGPFFDDYKTADSADPDAFLRSVVSYGYDIQCAFYTRGLKALGIHERPEFRFIVQETASPFALSVVGLAPSFVDLAEHKVARAIDIWQRCRHDNHWPGYPLRTCYLDAPEWAETQFMARDARAYDAARDAGIVDQLQRPLEDA